MKIEQQIKTLSEKIRALIASKATLHEINRHRRDLNMLQDKSKVKR